MADRVDVILESFEWRNSHLSTTFSVDGTAHTIRQAAPTIGGLKVDRLLDTARDTLARRLREASERAAQLEL